MKRSKDGMVKTLNEGPCAPEGFYWQNGVIGNSGTWSGKCMKGVSMMERLEGGMTSWMFEAMVARKLLLNTLLII